MEDKEEIEDQKDVEDTEAVPEDAASAAAEPDILKPLAAVIGIALVAVWLISIYPSFTTRRAMMKELEPALKEAKSLGLEYDTVLEGGDKYKDKSVLWCVQNRGENAVAYKGDTRRRISVSNYPLMPAVAGDKHAGCKDMLLKIDGVQRRKEYGFVTVKFMHKFG